ncbi:HEAT repeat-containing protein 5B [Smittium mucronatum]|uniref:HEAT repeat-containing protein 5B n=1 Tax=Smittium mucronatum TaxID=133383 RepID=A0A1R0GY50_9FUNG|nr:HEAT repeat-containing protein 5B [Smittium mucronatum]
MIVRIEGLRALSRIIFGGGKSIDDSILFEIFKCAKALIPHKTTLLSLSSAKVIRNLSACTNFFHSDIRSTEINKLLSSTLMRLVTTKVVRVRRELADLISDLMLSTFNFFKNGKSGIAKEFHVLFSENPKNIKTNYTNVTQKLSRNSSFSSPKQSSKEPLPNERKDTQSSGERRNSEHFKKDNPEISKGISVGEMPSLNSNSDVFNEDSMSLDVYRDNVSDFFPAGSINLHESDIKNEDFHRVSDDDDSKIMGDQDLKNLQNSMIRSLRYLSDIFNKHSSSREERTAIIEIYSSFFEKMGPVLIEEYYPVLVNHIIIDLLSFTQVQIYNPRRCVVNLGSIDSKFDSQNNKPHTNIHHLELDSTNIAVKNMVKWLLRVPISQNLPPDGKIKALKYLKKFWIDGSFYFKFENLEIVPESTELNGDYRSLFSSRMQDSWDGTNFNDFSNVKSTFDNFGESCLVVVLEEVKNLIGDLGIKALELDMFPLFKPRGDNYFGRDRYLSNSYSSQNHKLHLNNDPGSLKNSSIISSEVLIKLLKSNSDSVRLSSSICISSYLCQNPKLIAPVIEFMYIELQLIMSNASSNLQYFEQLNDSDIESKYAIKKKSSSNADLGISSEHYQAAVSFLQPEINELKGGLGFSQGISIIISNSLAKNPLFAPLESLEWIYEMAVKILKKVYNSSEPQICHVEKNPRYPQHLSTNHSIKPQNPEYDTSFEKISSSSKVFSFDPLGLNSDVGLPIDSKNKQNSQNNSQFVDESHFVTRKSRKSKLIRDHQSPKKAIFLHIKRMSFCNMQMNIGWSLLSCFFSIVPNIFGLEWFESKLESDWLLLWKLAMSRERLIGENSASFTKSKSGNSIFSLEDIEIDSTLYHVYSTMPWAERAHLLQSRSLSLLHLSAFLKTLVVLCTSKSELNNNFHVKDSVIKMLVKCIKNCLNFAEDLLDTPPPPKKGLDLGAVYGESMILSGSFDSLENNSGFYFKPNSEFKRSDFDLNQCLKWSELYLHGANFVDVRLPQRLLPNSSSLGTTHLNIRYHFISSSISLKLLGSNLSEILAPSTLKLCLHLLTGSNNEIDFYQARQVSAYRFASIIASYIQNWSDEKKNFTAHSINSVIQPLKPQWSYLSGFKGGSMGYESETGVTSILWSLVRDTSIVAGSGHEKFSYLPLAHGLNFGVDFNHHHFTSIDFSQWKNWCPDPPNYLVLLPISFQIKPNQDSFCEYTSLVDISIQYFGLIFSSLDESAQLHLLQEMLNRMQKLPYNSHRQAAILTNYLSAMFSALRIVTENNNKKNNDPRTISLMHTPSPSNSKAQMFPRLIPIKIASFMSDVARSALMIPSPSHRLLSSEIIGLLALGSESTTEYLSPLIELLTHQAIRSRDRFARSGTALALGSIYVHAGSIAASYHLQRVVVMLNSLASDPDPLIHMWALRALAEAAISAGYMFSKFGPDSLRMIVKLFMSDSHSYPFLGECMLPQVDMSLPLKSSKDINYPKNTRDQFSGSKESQKILKSNIIQHRLPSINNPGESTQNFGEHANPSIVAIGHNSAFRHPNSMTHKFGNNDIDSNINTSGSSNLAMGLETDWSRSCCEADLDGFDSRSALARVLNALILALGPSIRHYEDTFNLAISFMREIFKSGVEIGFNVNFRFLSNSLSCDQRVLTLSSDFPNYKIFFLAQKLRYSRYHEDIISFDAVTNVQTSHFDNSGNRPDSSQNKNLSLDHDFSFPFCDPDGTSLVLFESIQLIQQYQMFFYDFSDSHPKEYPLIYNDFCLDQIILNQVRPILRCTSTKNGLYDSPIIGGILDLQIFVTSTMESLIRLYGSRMLEKIPFYESYNSDLDSCKSSNYDSLNFKEAKSWVQNRFTLSSSMYVILGWSWTDILYEILLLHSSSSDKGDLYHNFKTLAANIDLLSNTIISHILNEEKDEIIKTSTFANFLYGFEPPHISQAFIRSFNEANLNQNEKSEKVIEKIPKVLETIYVLQVLITVFIDKNQHRSTRFFRKDLYYGQWASEADEKHLLSDKYWLDHVLDPNNGVNLKKDPLSSDIPRDQSIQSLKKSNPLNNFTKLLCVKLIIKILENTEFFIFGDKYRSNHDNELLIKRNWNVHIFSHLINDLIAVAYMSIKSPSNSKSKLPIAGFNLMSAIIKQFKYSPDIAIIEKVHNFKPNNEIPRSEISPILELYEAQIKSSIIPLISSFENEFQFNIDSNLRKLSPDGSGDFTDASRGLIGFYGVPDEPIRP